MTSLRQNRFALIQYLCLIVLKYVCLITVRVLWNVMLLKIISYEIYLNSNCLITEFEFKFIISLECYATENHLVWNLFEFKVLLNSNSNLSFLWNVTLLKNISYEIYSNSKCYWIRIQIYHSLECWTIKNHLVRNLFEFKVLLNSNSNLSFLWNVEQLKIISYEIYLNSILNLRSNFYYIWNLNINFNLQIHVNSNLN